jgi:hypothetical protein
MRCGLGIGAASKARTLVTVHLIEGCPAPHPLQGGIALAVTEAATSYAVAFGARELRLRAPVAAAVPIYRALGFELLVPGSGPTYCIREVRP